MPAIVLPGVRPANRIQVRQVKPVGVDAPTPPAFGLTVSSVFPFGGLFPTVLAISKERATVTYYGFFRQEVRSILVDEIDDVTLSLGLFSASLIISDFHHPGNPLVLTVANLSKRSAHQAQEILQKLMAERGKVK